MGAASSCGRGKDYLFIVTPEPAKDVATYGFDHSLKGMTGTDKLDVLWVIDNSNSMASSQKAVIDNTHQFISLFTQKHDLKWKMGLLSTDAADKPYVGFTPETALDWKTKDPVKTFQDAVGRLGVNGDAAEKTFVPIITSLATYPFVRPGSLLSIIMVTDAPEQSGIPGNAFLGFVNTMAGQGHVRIYGVLQPTDLCGSTADDPWNYEGSPYKTVIEGTNGFLFLLCSGKFAKDLASIGQDMVNRTSSKSIMFPDGIRPLPSTIQVLFHGEKIQGGLTENGGHWVYDYGQNSVDFNDLDFATGDNESVHIDYQAATQ
jgi:hypothetical protein